MAMDRPHTFRWKMPECVALGKRSTDSLRGPKCFDVKNRDWESEREREGGWEVYDKTGEKRQRQNHQDWMVYDEDRINARGLGSYTLY